MKLFRIILILSMLVCLSVVSLAQKGSRKVGIPELCGDLNYDQVVDMIDVMLLANYIAGNHPTDDDGDPFITGQADLNLDGKINISDLALMEKYLAGNVTRLPFKSEP